MRIAVVRPQVPFERGGAEIMADRLVEELVDHGHEAELVTVPFKWYPGARVLTQAFLWRLLDLDEADGRPIDLVVATKFPSYLVRHRNKRVWLLHQFRQAYELDGTELGQFGDSPEDRATAAEGAGARPRRARRGDAALRHLAQRRRPARALDGPRGRGAPAPAAGARVPVRGVRRLRPLRQPPRPCEAHRPPARGGRARPLARGRDRRRRARPRPSRGARARAIARRTRAVRRARLRGGAGRPLRALPRGLLRPGRRGLRDGPVRGVPLREAGADDDGRRGPARGRQRPAGRGSSSRPTAAELARAAGWLRDAPGRGGVVRRAGKAIAEDVTWSRAVERLLA